MRILIVEDDAPLASFLRKGLEAERYAVDVAPDGEQARKMALASDYDLLILDLNLPKLDGIGVLSAVRPEKPSLPVLVLTARSQVADRMQLLDAGADDCLIKPFSFTDLSARARALLRRGPRTVETVLQVTDMELDRVERKMECTEQDEERSYLTHPDKRPAIALGRAMWLAIIQILAIALYFLHHRR